MALVTHRFIRQRWVRRVSLALSIVYLAAAISLVPAAPAPAAGDLFYGPDPPGNGVRIYLSRASHTDTPGARGECNAPYSTPRTERDMSFIVALALANAEAASGGASLTTRHYRVRMGRGGPVTNSNRSNNWNARVHLPLHSNATGLNPSCGTDRADVRGIRAIFRGGKVKSKNLAASIKKYMDGRTPGTGDKICTISNCTIFNCLQELCGVDAARAVYSETEFHDWNKGTNFLYNRVNWYWIYAGGLDSALGYPR